METFILENLIPLLVIGVGAIVSTLCSMLDASIEDAGSDAPIWKRALSKLISGVAFNFGAAKNDPDAQ